MTEAGCPDATSTTPTISPLARAAMGLAEDHGTRGAPPDALPALEALEPTASYFSALRPRLAAIDPGQERAVEWFLDNEFLLHRALRQIAHDLPAGFYRRLPALTDGRPRVHDLARGLLAANALRLEHASLVLALEAYQQRVTLRTAELWALPTMLRALALERIVGALAELAPGVAPPYPPAPWAAEGLARDEVVGRAIRLLREVSAIHWEELFHQVSAVERALEQDPAGCYAGMDDETRNRYRSAVEELAWGVGQEETTVARAAVEWAARDAGAARRLRHVGHWLVGSGRPELERALGFRPAGLPRLRRWLNHHPARSYLGSLVAAMIVLWLVPLLPLWHLTSDPWVRLLGAVLFVLPASVLAVTLVQWVLTHLLRPSILPKMDFSDGIPEDCRTLVVVPALLGSQDEVQALVRQLDKHYLSNPDPRLEFAILGDFNDASAEVMPEDEQLAATAQAGVRLLNDRYGTDGRGPFHLLSRKRLWNPAQGCWMAWERKRGKLEELGRLLAGDRDTTYVSHLGREEGLEGIRFVITLDSDTALPHGTAARLIGILAHPLNEARFDERSGRVVEGYTVVQPRVDVAPTGAVQTRFSRIYAGDTAIDIYSRAVSEVYQDLSGTGSFIGKGIYEVQSFQRSLEGRVPENALLSHDLFEGLHGRAALATDVVLFEDYPTHYLAFARRLHRWIRGDWQILPWLFPRVPLADGTRGPNRLAPLDRWRILDNLRRSLVRPALLALLLAGWFLLPGSPWAWTALALAVPAGHLFLELVSLMARVGRRPRAGGAWAGMRRSMPEDLRRWLLFWVFLPHESFLTLDAVARTLQRMLTRRRLLEWRTAAHTDRLLRRSGRRASVWLEMWPAPLAAVLSGAALMAWSSAALAVAAPLLVSWLAAPEVALFLSRPARRRTRGPTPAEQRRLRALARRTWLFFETFVGPEDHWLAPDNFQEHPRGVVAHRTSPTNIGMLLVSTFAAHRLGFLTTTDLVARLRNALESIGRMEHYRGHLYNWYDTTDLRPLEPRYVSTVDSGNLAGDLLVLQQGCAEIAVGHVLRPRLWEGLRDTLELLRELVERIAREVDDRGPWRAVEASIERCLDGLGETGGDLVDWVRRLRAVCDVGGPAIDEALVAALQAGQALPERDLLRELRTWVDHVREHGRSMWREVEGLLPWIDALEQPPAPLAGAPAESELGESWARLDRVLRRRPRLHEIPRHCDRIRNDLAALRRVLEANADGASDGEETLAWLRGLERAVARGEERSQALRDELEAIGTRAESEAMGMDFTLLYDHERHLFRIGINVSADQPDPNHYDLLASEARLASFLAIAKGDAPLQHWFVLGRPATRIGGELVLLSWGASAFEYLMPTLLMRSSPETFLARSCRVAVQRQIAYGRARGVPWGISESGYHHFDPDRNYQYRCFGVPGLGFKRGLGEDLVIAPYAGVLALSLRPAEVLRNLERLEELGARGCYGLYESLDFTPSRRPPGSRFAIVRSHMAHHQGMILAAIANRLDQGVLTRLFHATPMVQTTEMLLNEQVPPVVLTEVLQSVAESRRAPAKRERPAVAPWTPRQGAAWPEAYALSNGRLTSVTTDSGGGGLQRHGVGLTRTSADVTRDDCGLWIYVRDEDSGALWSAGRNPTGGVPEEEQVRFHAHMAEFHRRDHGISLGMQVCVAPDADVELRRISLTNETDRPRELSLTSYAEVTLSTPARAARHPAFDKLFVHTEAQEGGGVLLFVRRPRARDDAAPVLLHRFTARGGDAVLVGFETDRARFLGRHGGPSAPRALRPGTALGAGSQGAVLDPVLALQVRVVLPPGGRAELSFVTAAADGRAEALELGERFSSPDVVAEAFERAADAVSRELSEAGVVPEALPAVQRLLSALLFPRPGLRPPGEALAAGRCGKPDLWGLGISGDEPIVALRWTVGEDSALLEELLHAQRLLRGRGVSFDLVVLREGASGYEDDVMGSLARAIEGAGAQAWMNRRGGVFAVRGDQVAAQDRHVVPSAARAVLDAARGSLDQQLDAGRRALQDLPPFVPPLPGPALTEPTPPLERERGLTFANPWGGLSEDGAEYVLHLQGDDPTPAPWCNVLANPDFGCLVSEAGLGYTWSVNAGEFRLTTWRNDPVLDPPSEALFLRDEETAALWSTTPLPTPGEGAYQVRHGIGRTRWRHHGQGLRQETEVFVAPDEPLKFVRLRVRNTWGRRRRLTATYYAEWVLGVTREESHPHVTPWYDPTVPALFARSSWNPEFDQRVVFLAADRDTHGFTCDRREFLGRDPSSDRPAALGRWGLAGRAESGGDPCAALQVHLELEPGEEAEALFVLGEGACFEEAIERARAARDPGGAQRAWLRTQEFWSETLGAVQVATPEPSFDALINRWLPYQVLASRVFGRTGFYQSSGAFGFRDQIQDCLALTLSRPELTRAHLLEAARHQFEDGDVLHWWHPPGDAGVRTRCSDDYLWLVYATAHYVRSTGDDSVLDERVPFLVADPLTHQESDRYSRFESTVEAHALFEHCRRALERAVPRGAHGLPLIGDGDWNDGMNRVGDEGRGESVWLAWFLCACYDGFAELCQRRRAPEQAARWRQASTELAAAIEREGWDGGWYLRAYDDEGLPLGSSRSTECRIDSIAQSWSVLSGMGDRGRASLAVQAAHEHLVRRAERLVLLLTPPFDHGTQDPGYIRGYPPGVRENGGQYTHAATWLAWACAELGDGDRAEELFRLINPLLRTGSEEDCRRYRVEPYVLAADVYGAEPHVGRGGWTWYSGAAAWMWRLGVEAILGLRMVEGHLELAPRIPASWPRFEVTLRTPDGPCRIRVVRTEGSTSPVVTLELNGKAIEGSPALLSCVVPSATPPVGRR